MFSYNRYPYKCASVQLALLATEILNESFLKCPYFTALYNLAEGVGGGEGGPERMRGPRGIYFRQNLGASPQSKGLRAT